jgi:hypothetical protein
MAITIRKIPCPDGTVTVNRDGVFFADVDVTSGGVASVNVPSVQTLSGRELMKTGQTTSFRTGDDGDIEAGRAVDFFILDYNNPFGNTNRFTDELGGQTYANNIVIDWSTYNGSTVLGIHRVVTSLVDWDTAIDNCLTLVVSVYSSGWRLINRNEVNNLVNMSTSRALNYFPFIYGASDNNFYWTSSTYSFNNTFAFRLQQQSGGGLAQSLKTGTSRYIPVRTFTVTGTTLS